MGQIGQSINKNEWALSESGRPLLAAGGAPEKQTFRKLLNVAAVMTGAGLLSGLLGCGSMSSFLAPVCRTSMQTHSDLQPSQTLFPR